MDGVGGQKSVGSTKKSLDSCKSHCGTDGRGRTWCLCFLARHEGTICLVMVRCAGAPSSRGPPGKGGDICMLRPIHGGLRFCTSHTRAGGSALSRNNHGLGLCSSPPLVLHLAANKTVAGPRSWWHRLPDGKGGPASAAAYRHSCIRTNPAPSGVEVGRWGQHGSGSAIAQ